MKKLKNKKSLILAVSALAIGAGVIGVAAACAPTKNKKPINPTPTTPSKQGSDEETITQATPTVSLDENAKLTKNKNKYDLVLNVTNANDKYLKAELSQKVAEGQTAVKKIAQAKVENNKATLSFE